MTYQNDKLSKNIVVVANHDKQETASFENKENQQSYENPVRQSVTTDGTENSQRHVHSFTNFPLRLKKNFQPENQKQNIIKEHHNVVYHEKYEEINDSREKIENEHPSFRMSYLEQRPESVNSGSNYGDT